jgi:hypothetical protein
VGCEGCLGGVGCVGCVGAWGVWGVWGVWGAWGCGGHSLRSTFHRLHLLRLWTPTILALIKLDYNLTSTSWHSSSGLIGRRRTYRTIFEWTGHGKICPPTTSEAGASWPRRDVEVRL